MVQHGWKRKALQNVNIHKQTVTIYTNNCHSFQIWMSFIELSYKQTAKQHIPCSSHRPVKVEKRLLAWYVWASRRINFIFNLPVNDSKVFVWSENYAALLIWAHGWHLKAEDGAPPCSYCGKCWRHSCAHLDQGSFWTNPDQGLERQVVDRQVWTLHLDWS